MCLYHGMCVLWVLFVRWLCLFVVWSFPSNWRIFFSYRDAPLPVKRCKFWHGRQLRPLIMSSEVFFSVPHLLWHWISVYNGHLQEPVTLTPIAERLTVELSLPVITTYTQPTAYGANALTHCATATAPATVVNDQISFGNWLEGDRLMALVMCGDGNSIVPSCVDHTWSRPV